MTLLEVKTGSKFNQNTMKILLCNFLPQVKTSPKKLDFPSKVEKSTEVEISPRKCNFSPKVENFIKKATCS